MGTLPTTLLQKHCEVISKNITTIDYSSETFKVKELKEKYLKRKFQWEYQKITFLQKLWDNSFNSKLFQKLSQILAILGDVFMVKE